MKLLCSFLCLLLIGCSQQLPQLPVAVDNEGYTYDVRIIEGCQYLSQRDWFTHKGNCTNPIHKATQVIYERAWSSPSYFGTNWSNINVQVQYGQPMTNTYKLEIDTNPATQLHLEHGIFWVGTNSYRDFTNLPDYKYWLSKNGTNPVGGNTLHPWPTGTILEVDENRNIRKHESRATNY